MTEKEESNSKSENPTVEEKKEPKISLMKKGDYTVHILLEEVKNLIQIDENKLPNPIVKITCFEQTKRSEQPETACDSYSFGEHFYFEKSNLTIEQLDSSKINIEVYDYKNSSNKSKYFGIYEYDLDYIYNQPNHCLKNFWLALANPLSDNISKVRGFLKLSISVLNENDPKIELNLDNNINETMIPSQIKLEYEMISIYFMRAENLPDMDAIFKESKVNKQCDAYIEVLYGGISKKTSVIKQVNDIVEINEIIDFPVSIPTVSQKVIFLIKDKDIDNDDLIGSIEIDIGDIIGNVNKYQEFKFIDIYGAPYNKKGKIFDLMNQNSEIGSKWRGRILLKILHEKTDTPSTEIRKIEDLNLINQARNLSRKNLWSLYAKLYNVYYLPTENEEYSIGIAMQDQETFFSAKKADKSCIDFKQFKTLQCQSLAEKKDDLPDVFIYLYNSKKEPICFQRIKARDFYLNERIMIIKLFPDPCVDKIQKIYQSGLIKVKICIFNRQFDKQPESINNMRDGDSDNEENNDLNDDLENILNKPSDNNLGFLKLKETYTVVCIVYMSRYLISGDSSGNNDPYVSLTCLNNEQHTSVKYNTINGIWNDKLIFDNVELNLNKKSTWPIFLLKILDYDKIGKDDLLAYSYIWLSDSHYHINNTNLVKPKWSQLFLPKSNKPQGEILLSFYIFDNNHRKEINNLSPIPETTPYSFEINILGLRDLKPLSILPVKKAYIKFDMNSLNVTGKEEDSLNPIITQPKDCGSNPTINTVIKFDIQLPKEEIFMPDLQCEIYDNLFSNMINPLLGIFLINVKSLIKKTNEQINEDLKITKIQIGALLAKGILKKNLKFGTFSHNENEHEKEEDEEIQTYKKSETDLIDDEKKTDINLTVNQSSSKLHFEEKDNLIDNYNNELSKIMTHVEDIDYDNNFIDDNKDKSEYFVLLPKFKNYKVPGNEKNFEIENLEIAPSNKYYMGIGYINKIDSNEDENSKKNKKEKSKIINISKHYRRYYGMELERVKELKLSSPFNSSFVRRGKDTDVKNENDIFSAISEIGNKIIKSYPLIEDKRTFEDIEKEEKESKKRIFREALLENIVPKNLKNRGYGKFKAVIRIAEKSKMEEYEKAIEKYKSKPEIINELKNLRKYEKLTKGILVRNSVIIRIYVLQLRNLPRKDILNESDPYIKIYLGDTLKIDERKKYIEDSKDADWYKYYDIQSEFPGESTLKLEVWDYDPIFKDQLIGYTTIDLEDRYFNSNWRDLQYKPIETRNLKNPDSIESNGNVTLWIEIFEKKDRINMEPWQISKEPINTIEMRLVIYETEKMKNLDVEETSDIYINAFVDPKIKQSTDVHYRCYNGIASFNWRIVIPIEVPSKFKTLKIQVYDKDLFSSDDYICGSELDISNLIMIPKDLDLPILFNKHYYKNIPESERNKYNNVEFLSKLEDNEQTKFWIQCYNNGKKEGRVLCSLEFLPKWKADLNKVGLGRKEPNISPYLPPPMGRFEWSLNPFKILNQFVGPSFRRKLYCWICVICLIIYLICFLPYILLHVTSQIVNPFNYGK